MKTDRTYLHHICDAIAELEEFNVGGEQAFCSRRIVQVATIRCLEVIGEATKKLSDEFRSEHPEVPWKQIAGMRDILIHAYHVVDLDLVWQVVEQAIPDLKSRVHQALQVDRG